MWFGDVDHQQTQQINQSKFSKELQWIDQIYYDGQEYENQEEEKEPNPDKNQDYDSEEEEKEKPKLSKEDTKDMFANFFTQASSNYDP